jgi:hypothetical protein
MLKVILIWLFAFTAAPDQTSSDPLYNCKSYSTEIKVGQHINTEPSCYTSTLFTHKKKHLLTVSTENTYVRFAVLERFDTKTGYKIFAVIAGQPDQMYIIQEDIRVVENATQRIRYYYFSYRPINISTRPNRNIVGQVLEVSNQIICK